MLKKFLYCSLVFLTLFLLLGSKPANASTSVTVTNDGFGGSFTLAVTGDCTTGCTVTLTIDTTALTNPGDTGAMTDIAHAQDNINAVAWKLGSGSTVGTGFTGDPGATWNTTSLTSLGSGTSGACMSMTGDVQACTSAGTPVTGSETGGTLTWVWTGVIASDSNISHVGYQYNDETFTTTKDGVTKFNGNIVSCGFDVNGASSCTTTTTAPPPGVSEPSSMAIMGIGMVGLAALLRRRVASQA